MRSGFSKLATQFSRNGFTRRWTAPSKGRLATAVIGGALVFSTLAQPLTAMAYSPQALYDEVWKLVNSRFVDVEKNGQDWKIWRHRYDNVLVTEEDSYVAIETMLNSLGDRYTRFLDPEEFAEEGRSIQARLFGIGIQIGVREEKLVVIAPIEETPAFNAGLKPNDEITKIDGVSTKGMSVKDAANKIRGEKGTEVVLTIKRGEEDPKDVPIVRDEIKLKAVSTKNPLDIPVPGNMSYIKISSFLSNNTAYEMRNALKEGATKDGYIIDLRSNPGGLLSNAIAIADFFLEDGSIVSTVDRDGYKEIRNASVRTLTDKPIVLLIDEGSASASEILSGALRDNNRALLVGKRSFGKGLVQEINQLPGGSGVNITTQRYLTPNDTDINKMGIQPDIFISVDEKDIEAKRDPQLAKAIEVMSDIIAGKSVKDIQSRSLTQPVSTATPTADEVDETDADTVD